MENYFDKVKKESREDFEVINYDELLDDAVIELKNTDPSKIIKY